MTLSGINSVTYLPDGHSGYRLLHQDRGYTLPAGFTRIPTARGRTFSSVATLHQPNSLHMTTFKHSGDLGDIIYSLPTIASPGGGELLLDVSGGAEDPMCGHLIDGKTNLNHSGPNSTPRTGAANHAICSTCTWTRLVFRPGTTTHPGSAPQKKLTW